MLAASTDVASTTNASLEHGSAVNNAEEMIIGTERISDDDNNNVLGGGITSRRLVTADWNFNAGEQVHALETARFTPSLPHLHCNCRVAILSLAP